ncbi:MAG: hypothetical protein UX35_C0003G0092 [Microgenomates group bacterium GW2011_GWA1_46_15]|nr:MAG: hypothetical protein UX00_C0004G0046 [Microgenomates group bacterium GW2011_GWB1_45_17]KKU23956.1 MAG: hypothetical protein UX35_C0003G0092 [Microgenomates group bacterium GW2011_GWA1_46_15]KKU24651.1 MAG: hypothetical protein UX36_C0001G0268 [Microgenomates group bacterium GW2011_GWC1_46_15]
MLGTAQSSEMNNLQAWKEHGSKKAAALLVALMLEQAKDKKEKIDRLQESKSV